MSRTLYLTPFLAVILLLAFGHFRDTEANKTERANRSLRSKSSDDSVAHGMPHDENHRTKSKDRPDHPKPTIEETTELLRCTIIPVLEFEDHTVAEGIEILNQLIREQGIEPHRLRVVVPATDPVRDLRIMNLEVRNIPLAHILKHVCGRTRLRYRVVENGMVEVLDQLAVDDDISGTESAESEVEFLPVPDAVGKTPAESDEPDPFAPAAESE